MSETANLNLSGVAETLLITVYLRAMESQRPDALIKDEKAIELVTRMSNVFDEIRRIPLHEANRLVIIMRNREFDRYVRNFLAQYPEAVVVHIGCGLDSRFERVDNGLVEWYDLDLPEVIDLRRRFIGDEKKRYHLLAGSVLDDAWMETVSGHPRHPFLFLAEGVFMYFREAQVRSLVLQLRDRFPGAQLVFDTYSPSHVWVHNLQMSSKVVSRAHWGIRHGQKLEGWGDNIRLLGEWGFMDRLEPRLNRIRWMRPIELLFRTLRIYHFQLGKAAG